MTNKPMLSVELLPCPFCGSPAILEDHRLIWSVRCTKCSACVLGDRAPEPHGDGVSSDEAQDAQAAAMSESTDLGAYQKSAVDAWNARAEKASKSQVVPAGATHFEKSDKCPSTGNIQYYRHDGCCRWSYWPEGLNYWSPLACKPTGDIQEIIDKQPAPVADHTQCGECKGWGYHENHHEGGGTECGECGGSGNATVSVVMPDVDELAQIIRKVNGSHTLGAGSLAEAILEEVARLNGVKP